MNQKQKCIACCKQFLQQLQLEKYFSISLFNHYYTKNSGSLGNPYNVGMNAADFILFNSKA